MAYDEDDEDAVECVPCTIPEWPYPFNLVFSTYLEGGYSWLAPQWQPHRLPDLQPSSADSTKTRTRNKSSKPLDREQKPRVDAAILFLEPDE